MKDRETEMIVHQYILSENTVQNLQHFLVEFVFFPTFVNKKHYQEETFGAGFCLQNSVSQNRLRNKGD